MTKVFPWFSQQEINFHIGYTRNPWLVIRHEKRFEDSPSNYIGKESLKNLIQSKIVTPLKFMRLTKVGA